MAPRAGRGEAGAGSPAGPQRTCCGCRKTFPRNHLVRIVRDATGRPVLDLWGRLPGRGAHVCPTAACLQVAVARGGLARSFRARTLAPEEGFHALLEEVRRGARARCLDLLGLHRREGLVFPGEACLAALADGRCALVVLGGDVPTRDTAPVEEQARYAGRPVFRLGSREDLERAIGLPTEGIVGVGRMPGRSRGGPGLTESLERELWRASLQPLLPPAAGGPGQAGPQGRRGRGAQPVNPRVSGQVLK